MSQVDNLDPQTTIRPRNRKRILVVAILVAVAAVCIPGLYVYVIYDGAGELERAIAETDELDPDWQFQDLLTKQATIPDELNGALRVLEAYKLFSNTRGPVKPLPLIEMIYEHLWDLQDPKHPALQEMPPPNIEFTRGQTQGLREGLAKESAALKVALTLANYPRGRSDFQWDGRFTTPPNLAVVHYLELVANLISFDILMKTQENDTTGGEANAHTRRGLPQVRRGRGSSPTSGD